MIPIGKKGRIIEGKANDFTEVDVTGWFVYVECKIPSEQSCLILIAREFDHAGRPIFPDPHPTTWNPDCGFDFSVEDRQLLEEWFQDAGLKVDWDDSNDVV